MLELKQLLGFEDARLRSAHWYFVVGEPLKQFFVMGHHCTFQLDQLAFGLRWQALPFPLNLVLVCGRIEALLLALLQSLDLFVDMGQLSFILIQLLDQLGFMQAHLDSASHGVVGTLKAMWEVVLVDVLVNHRLYSR
ncbi:hypothetical protein D3C78_1590400 [compost metagenome]